MVNIVCPIIFILWIIKNVLTIELFYVSPKKFIIKNFRKFVVWKKPREISWRELVKSLERKL